MGVSTIACIGSGNMGFALMKGAAAVAGGANIGFTDINGEKAKTSAAALGGTVFDSNAQAAEKSGFIFLAVKPSALMEVLEEIAPVMRKRLAAGDVPVLVSLAAGWTVEKIQAAVGVGETGLRVMQSLAAKLPMGKKAPAAKVPIVRIMPNTPALISKGMIVYAASAELSGEKEAELKAILKSAGVVDRIDENYLDAVTGLSGSGPAFAYLFIEALADGGVRAGLPRDKAIRYAAQTVFGSAAMVLETGKHPGELKDMVCSPGGTTIAGIAALESGSFRGTVIQAVEAACRRSKELA